MGLFSYNWIFVVILISDLGYNSVLSSYSKRVAGSSSILKERGGSLALVPGKEET